MTLNGTISLKVRVLMAVRDETQTALARALGSIAGPVFPNGAGGHLTADHVGRLIRRHLGHGAHTLRHRYATRAYAGSHDLRAVQELLGHASPTTTARYVSTGEQQLHAAASWAA
jgi:site-specific recombinase XerD